MQIVRAWRRSGRSARAFAAEHGICDATLYNWGRGVASALTPEPNRTEVELVEVIPVGAEAADRHEWAWEIETRGGVLRGRDRLDAGAVSAIVGALGRARR